MGKFIIESALLGAGLAMDAFSVSVANGLAEPDMKRKKAAGIAGVFALFQFLMPLLGYFMIRSLMHVFRFLEMLVPWIALILLTVIGVKMILDGLRHTEEAAPAVGTGGLILQGIATSIDALSAGFAFAEYSPEKAFLASGIILAVTFCICLPGVYLGRKFGTVISGRATVLGGVILVVIGLEIFLSGIL